VHLAAGPPTHWTVTLTDGSVVDVYADSVTGLSGPEDTRDYVFGSLMDVSPELQNEFEVTAGTPSDPRRVEVMVARFPRATVRNVSSTA
jgi:hypothetical protein